MDIERLTAATGQRAISQGEATYRGPGVPGGEVTPITAVLDRNFQVLDEDQLERSINVMAVQVSQVPDSSAGDTIIRGGTTWRVGQMISDDGYERVLEVYPQ